MKTMPALPPDPTLDEIRAALGPVIPVHAGFDGWSDTALVRAAEQIGVDPGIARLALPDGAPGMIDAWFAAIDAEMAQRLPPELLGAMKIRDRITALVDSRIAIAAPNREALRRALAILAMPQNLALGVRLGWRAADVMWQLAGDVATDYNHYTKRTLLAGVYGATMLVLLDDQSEGLADTRDFLNRRIEGVMRFEKVKSQFLARRERMPSLSRFIGRLRYPAV
ncbi:ubiquinone biosynthesis protein COQ9 [Sphingobium boeckii]|uniref:Ubiquinone biosynthesis protein COQ9 n=2 Tax=Sphingobium boeckii TaxID=1082345 RepID=A0A7W9AET5_9SPHN|nr:ubiquinone biosynthesis protein COQ9 [Sphingobium boeckii]